MAFQTIQSISGEEMGLRSQLPLPNLRSLFPDLLSPPIRPSSPTHNTDRNKPTWSAKDSHKDINLFSGCKPGCNCDSNMLGDSINFYSRREKQSSLSSASSSPLLATPQSDSAGLPLDLIRMAEKGGLTSQLTVSEPFFYMKEATAFQREYVDWSKIAYPSAFQKVSRSNVWETDTRAPANTALDHPGYPPSGNDAPATVQKPYRCNYCKKRFARPSSLNTHIYSHTGEKPFQCKEEGCNRRFSVLSNLRRHTKLHTRSKRGYPETPQNLASTLPRPSPSLAYHGERW